MSKKLRLVSLDDLQRIIAEHIEISNQLQQRLSGHRDNRLTELHKELTQVEEDQADTVIHFIRDWAACKSYAAAVAFLNHRGLTPDDLVPDSFISVPVTIAGVKWRVDWYNSAGGVRISYYAA